MFCQKLRLDYYCCDLNQSKICIDMFFKVSLLWIPYIIFKNTDRDEAMKVDEDIRTLVSVTRLGDFVRSGLDQADEV